MILENEDFPIILLNNLLYNFLKIKIIRDTF